VNGLERRDRVRGALSSRTVVALVGCYLMLQAVSTDLYLASLPGLTRTFAVSAATVQLTLSVFVLGFGTMQLVLGPIADRHGRYPVLLGGLAVYAVGSVACALAPSIGALIAGRFVQAVACCAVVVAARAVVRDVYDPAAGARVMAQASTIVAIGPLLGPIIGSFLEVRYGFRAAFVVLTLFALALLAATIARFEETHRQRDAAATRPRVLLANYRRVLGSREFLLYTVVASASYGGLFAFISASSFVLVRVLGVPTEYFGFGFAFCVSGFLLGTLACRRMLTRRSLTRMLEIGAAMSAGSGLVLAALAASGVSHWAAVLLPMFVFFAAHGINLPCGQVGSAAPFPRLAGVAAGLFGFLMMLGAALVGSWIGASHDGTVRPLAYTVAALGVVVWATVRFGLRRLAPSRTAGGEPGGS
jgi:DHA1 family bicyclomycin/chloramphenicol resistance-like MFS transporter